MRKTKLKVLIIGILIFIVLVGYYFYKINSFFTGIGPCVMENGPCYGKNVQVQIDSITIEAYLTIPNGQLAVANMGKDVLDSIPPILIRLNNNNQIIWAISLDTKVGNCEIPLFKMRNIQLVDDKLGKRITFFNESYSEPGKIYLKGNWDFDYMCLNSM